MSTEKLAEALRLAELALVSAGVGNGLARQKIIEALAAHEAEQVEEVKPVAWRWEHYHVTTGAVVGSGLSAAKVQPTKHALLAGDDFDNGWIGTRVQPLYTRPQQPLSEKELDTEVGIYRPQNEDEEIGFRDGFRAAQRHFGITKDTK